VCVCVGESKQRRESAPSCKERTYQAGSFSIAGDVSRNI
jgi:hypothetical protein